MQDQKLMDYFKFDEDDLAANRLGSFTDKQKARLAREGKSDRTKHYIGAGCLLIVTIFLVLVAVALAFFARPPLKGWDKIWIAVFGFLALWPFFFMISNLQSAFAKFQVKLQKVEGPVNIIKAERTSTDTDLDGMSHTSHYFAYELHIRGEEFDVDEDLADVMMQGDTYAIYYSEGSEGDILSAELISKAK